VVPVPEKTTVADAILKKSRRHRIAYLPHDAYYRDLKDLALNQRAQTNFDHRLARIQPLTNTFAN